MTRIKTIDDLSFATDYIRRKFLSRTWPGKATHDAAKLDFPEKLDNATLSAWCNQWLSDDQRQKLAAAIRSARKRRHNPDKTTVTVSAHSKIARRELVTLSEAVFEVTHLIDSLGTHSKDQHRRFIIMMTTLIWKSFPWRAVRRFANGLF